MNSIPIRFPRRTAPTPEQRRLSSAQWTITRRISLVMSVIMLIIGVIVYGVMLFAQRADAERETQWGIDHNTIDSPPVCVWMTVERDGAISSTPGTPAGLPVRSSLAAVRAGVPTVLERVRRGGEEYTVRTAWRGAEVVQAAYGERFQRADRNHLLLAFAAAEAVGLLLVAVASGVLARRAMRPLSEALDRQRRFVADASHELRTPLTQLHTRAQLLVRRSGSATPQQLATDLRRLVTGTRQLGDVIDDLLLSARLSQSPGSRDPVDLATLAKEAVSAEDARAQAMRLTVALRCGPGRHVVMGTTSALRRVIAALVDNAMGHTPPGGEVVVSVDALLPGIVSLSVSDTGVGFAPEEATRMFERFARGAAGRGRRFGLGLALAREVVESHGGRITAAGRPGHGALFTVELPAARVGETIPRQRTIASCLSAGGRRQDVSGH
ncbi:sensor histidine kinase [Streptomyces antimycoticus]|uniref:sensor histidine kinase n=1 Tax=Streptomyces antimycoticus TaxID=68175 RepID=UPI0025712289|nr:HAMP domain-containing sensor histidine kinase [Streptomyces antimycoticus]WJD94961.1 HAMP domain-containing sensor histidine kinase [Streptomyces antimycoticus]